MSKEVAQASRAELLQEVVNAELAYRERRIELNHQLEQARRKRNQVMSEAAAQGLTLREMARVLGISFQRIHQIIDASR